MKQGFRRVTFPKPAARTTRPERKSDRASTWNALQALLSEQADHKPPPTEAEAMILRAFGRHPNSLLDIPDISKLPAPFEYHSKYNADATYVTEPRLSVTKLLTSAWCELREYYTVYGGSPRIPASARMKSGTEYHARIEGEEHFQIDMDQLDQAIEAHLARVPADLRQRLVLTEKEYVLAHNWIEHNIKRLLHLSDTRQAREIYVHAFLDLDYGHFVTHSSDLKNAVLVNGIADIVRVEPGPAASEIVETPARPGITSLEEQITHTSERLAHLSKTHTLVMGDIKTRDWSNVPAQESVVAAAKTQCMYYAQMFHNLAQNKDFAYESYLENASRRRTQANAPISVAFAVKLLVAHFKTIVVDCLDLAQGKPMGGGADANMEAAPPYSLGSLLSETEFRELLMAHYGEDPDIMDMDLSPLFQPWQKPLTLAYVASRAARLWSAFGALRPTRIEVEYHNVKTQKIFSKKAAPFDADVLQRSISDASSLWSGRRPPTHTEDLSRCQYCDFKKRCSAVNEQADGSILQKIYELQSS